MAGTGGRADQQGAALANPATESGATFGTGFIVQGVTDRRAVKYYVPHTGTSWNPLAGTSLGLSMRLPYRASSIDSITSKWEAIGDLSFMQQFQQVRFGAQVERMFGGAADMVPRRLRAGAYLGRPGQYALAYEWRGTPRTAKFDFHRNSSHLGGEIVAGKYVALRTGYVWSREHRMAFGIAFGLLARGWRVETSWDVPTGDPGETRWSVGIGFRG